MTTPPEELPGGGGEAPPSETSELPEILPYDGRPSTDEEIRAVLRRIERMMLFWGALALVLWLVFVGSVDGAAILTLTCTASIVSFRGLQTLVWRLGSRDGGKIDRRSQVFAALRFAIILLLPAASLWLDSRQALALIAGFSALPLALMSEGVAQFFTKPRSEPSDGI